MSRRKIDRILISTVPRSGTVFFSRFVSELLGLEEIRPRCVLGPRPNPPEWNPFRADDTYRDLGKGELLTSHYFLEQPIRKVLESPQVLGIFLYRDPRDVAVSSAMYVKHALQAADQHPFHSLLSKLSDQDAITFMLSGGIIPAKELPYDVSDPGPGYVIYRGMGYFCEMAYPWLLHPGVAKVRYEDFTRDPVSCLAAAFGAVGVEIAERRISELSWRLNFSSVNEGRKKGTEDRSSHFRKGVAGDYVNHFNELHRALCKYQIGDDLVRLGYERSLDW